MKAQTKLSIKVPSRLHLSLFAMDSPLYRLNGGMGFAITGHDLSLHVIQAKEFSIHDRRKIKLSKSQTQKLISILSNVKNLLATTKYISIEIMKGSPSHTGFGTGTALAMAIVEAYLILTEVSYEHSDVVRLSERGGTSGVGINTYFEGGFVFDLGHKYQPGQVHLPTSSHIDKKGLPLKLLRVDMPDWGFGVFTPSGVSTFSGQSELDFFSRTCPISHEEASSALYHGTFGILAAILEADKSSFCRGLNAIQKTKWKQSEIFLYDKKIEEIITTIMPKSNAVGMSSMGPTLFIIADNINEIKKLLSDNSIPGSFSFVKPNNYGRTIKYV